eukprot:m.241047 g.241047  ORF g.241047 m.241047 type:complete len:71 (-) comp16085_c0_seq11:437-649(-)
MGKVTCDDAIGVFTLSTELQLCNNGHRCHRYSLNTTDTSSEFVALMESMWASTTPLTISLSNESGLLTYD